MLFTSDTADALLAAAHLVNSAEEPDSLATLADLDAFLAEHPYSGRIDRDERELDALRKLRPQLRALLLASRDEMAAAVDDVLRATPLTARLVRHDDLDWHLHAVADDRPLAERILVETTMALVDVIRADETTRLSVCADDMCADVVLDLSRNRSKRYCSTSCANRNAVAAYRARRAQPR